MIKYKANKYLRKIDIVEICGETEHFVRLGTARREAKESEYHSYKNTWEEAHQVLLELCLGDVESARSRLQRANDRLGNVKGMKPPRTDMECVA